MKVKKVALNFLPLIVFVLVISINFFKPFGFFRESNAAMVCINYNYWVQNAALKNARIPVESYMFDTTAKPVTQMWSTVMSIGYGWFLVTYWFFSFLHVAPGEISLRIFSLGWLAFTLFIVWLLCSRLIKNVHEGRVVRYLTILFYVFNASVLWYHVQGYVHEIAVLPFYFLSWFFFLRYMQNPSVKFLVALGFSLFIAVQFDWLPCFQAAVMTVYLFVIRRKVQSNVAFLLPAASVALGICLIVYTYASWVGFANYMDFLKDKFISRTVGSGGLQVLPGVNYNCNLLLFYAVGFGLLAVLFLWGLARIKQQPVIWLMIISAVMHHFVFWGFSTEHDHAVVKTAFPVAFVAAVVISRLTLSARGIAACIVIAVNIGIYFFLHNFYTRKGMYSHPNFCYEAGKMIRSRFGAKDQYIFINTQGKYLLQIEFYAGKYYLLASSIEEAKSILHEKFPGGTGFFIDGDKNGVAEAVEFR